MQYQSIVTILSLVLLLSACSGSDGGAIVEVSDSGSATSSPNLLPNQTASLNPINPVSEPLEQPAVNDTAIASGNAGTATLSDNSSDVVASEATIEETTEETGDILNLDNLDGTATLSDNSSDVVASEATIEETTEETGDILNLDNVDAVILQAFEVYSGRAYDRRMTDFPYIEDVAVQFQRPQFNEFGDVLVYRSLSCNSDGSVSETSSEAYEPLLVNSFYSACTIGSDQLNGRVVLSESGNGGFQRQFSDFFSVDFPGNGVMEVSGSYQYQPSLAFTRELVVADLNYSLSYDGGALSVRNANTTRSYRPDDRSVENRMEGSFTMTPPVLNGATVSVTTTEAFENLEKSSQLSYAQGRLQIIASDSEIIVDAANGDPNTVEVSVIGSDGPVTTRTVGWQRWHDALAFVPSELNEFAERVEAQPGSDSALINQNSYAAILRSAFDIYSGESFGPDILQMPGYTMPDTPPGFGQSGFPNGFAEPVLETCDNGGSAVLTPYKWGASQVTTGWNSEFSNCERDGVLYEGIFKTRNFGNRSYRSPGISIVDADGSKQLNGILNYKYTANRDGSPTRNISFSGSYAYNTQGENSFEIANADNLFGALFQYLELISGKFDMKNAATGQDWVAVSTPDPLVTSAFLFETTAESNTESINYPISGLMVLDAGNGNSLWLRPDNGDVETFEIFIYSAGADPIQLTEAWSDWLPYIQFNFDLHNR